MGSRIKSNVCDRCQVLQFDDSVLAGGFCEESGTYYFQLKDPGNIHPILAYDLRDVLPELPILSDSAQKGCDFCRILRISILKDFSHCVKQEIRVRLQLVFDPEGKFRSILARIGFKSERRESSRTEDALLMFGVDGEPQVNILYLTDPCTQWLRLQSSPQDDIFCSKNVEKVNYILDDVETRESTGPSFYPTRLIHVGARGSNICRLVITDPDLFGDQRPKYAALSYCWGPPEDAKTQFKTEHATLQDRISGFQLETTSQITQDAVEVCRALDIPYLWIDAVCIIQDDKADWERESAEMTNVYQSAHLTICTPTSTSCREGFLGSRISAAIPFRSRINPHVVGAYKIRPCGAISDEQIAEGDYERLDNSDTSPLNNWWKRGWTFQELALSKRVLLFGIKLHLVFEDKFWSEGDEMLTEADEELPMDGMGGTFAVISVASALESKEDESMWMSMVEQYTARQLTFESDKLPAMGGLAKIAVLGRGDRYLAGIRADFLHRDLFWTPAVQSEAQGKIESKVSYDSLLNSLNAPKTYIAPSWSWARWKGKIRFDESPAPYGDHVPVMEGGAQIEKAYKEAEAWTLTSKLNPFGQVTEGSLRFTGKVVPVLPQLTRQEGIENHWEMYDESGQYIANLTFDWDELGDRVPFEQMSLALIGSYWSWNAYKMARLTDEDDSEVDTDIYEGSDVDMVSSEDEDEQMDDLSSESEEIDFEEAQHRDVNADKFAYGLIIHPAERKEKYFRVGIFSSWPKGSGGLRGYFGNREVRSVDII
ncbi:HET-domain-containing protein [Hypoxylon sp. FL1857]|nr:HET-domain-containing protein [Hypoxylon sp. FL1857]